MSNLCSVNHCGRGALDIQTPQANCRWCLTLRLVHSFGGVRRVWPQERSLGTPRDSRSPHRLNAFQCQSEPLGEATFRTTRQLGPSVVLIVLRSRARSSPATCYCSQGGSNPWSSGLYSRNKYFITPHRPCRPPPPLSSHIPFSLLILAGAPHPPLPPPSPVGIFVGILAMNLLIWSPDLLPVGLEPTTYGS